MRALVLDESRVMRALVLDGSRAMRALLSRILREAGFEVLEAGRGDQGLEILRRYHATRPFELVLLDGALPGLDGQELVRAVRADRAFAGIRFVMVSSDTAMSRVQEALAAGVDEYAMKPFTKEVILEKLAILGLAVP